MKPEQLLHIVVECLLLLHIKKVWGLDLNTEAVYPEYGFSLDKF